MTAIGKRLFKTYTSLLFGVTGVDNELGGRDTSVEFWFYQKGKKSVCVCVWGNPKHQRQENAFSTRVFSSVY